MDVAAVVGLVVLGLLCCGVLASFSGMVVTGS